MEKGCPLYVVASAALSGYTVGKAAGAQALPSGSEVRLPQGLRFTDVRRSGLGDFPLARGSSCAAKSCGRLGLRPLSRLLCSLRLPSTASIYRAHLPGLLDGISRPERPPVRALRRPARRADPGRSIEQRPVPELPDGAAAL